MRDTLIARDSNFCLDEAPFPPETYQSFSRVQNGTVAGSDSVRDVQHGYCKRLSRADQKDYGQDPEALRRRMPNE
jgi:hypothetical protein